MAVGPDLFCDAALSQQGHQMADVQELKSELSFQIEKLKNRKCPHCQDMITASCFFASHFDWCLNHQDLADHRHDNKCFHRDANGTNCSIEYGGKCSLDGRLKTLSDVSDYFY
ncbi:hypothetical protein LOZ57_006933 [Ophidiomyces ophidiicola]|uniref:uncharacterized protein n=1 Tax=Ophidiomyces ophidiicola TaxID=1387563 RepID=UPI0020C55C29|nr:uncharacterized protein LOZ57_006933 [Ophidiomyces ophidiicola]KAI1934739.1 hypothetical protein LOZ57_006933 [Ophidiomyces ophidiicola]